QAREHAARGAATFGTAPARLPFSETLNRSGGRASCPTRCGVHTGTPCGVRGWLLLARVPCSWEHSKSKCQLLAVEARQEQSTRPRRRRGVARGWLDGSSVVGARSR